MVRTQKGDMRLQRSTGGNKIKNEKEVYMKIEDVNERPM